MGANLGSLTYFIRAKNDDFKRVIADTKQSINGMNTTFQNSKKQAQDWGTSITNNLTKIETSFKKTGDNLSILGQKISMKISLPLALASGAAIKLAMDAVESENLFTESMGKMADSARKWSEDLRKNLGLNAYEIRQNVGVFNVMLTSMGLTEEAAFGMSKGLTQLVYDMASFYNLKPEVAFEKLQAGISGESEPLKRLGIIVNETTIKNYALTHGLIEQGEELSETGKVVARYGTIMEATSKAQGDLSRTIDSPANKLRILQSELKQTTIDLGMALLPAFQSLMKMAQPMVKVLENIATWFNKLSPAMQETVGYLIALTIASGPGIKALGLFFKVGSGVVGVLKLLTQGGIIAAIKGIGTAFVSAATGATTATVAATGLAAAFTPFLVGGVIVAGLIGIVAWLGKIREHAKLAATDIANISDIDTMQKKIKQLQDDIAKEKLRLKKESQGVVWYNNLWNEGKTFRPDFSKLDELTEDLNKAQEKLKILKVNPGGLDTETLKKEMAETIAAIQKEMANSFKFNTIGESEQTALELQEQLLTEHLERIGQLKQAEIEKENQRYKDELETAKGNKKLIEQVEQAHTERLGQIDKDFREKCIKQVQDELDAKRQAQEKALNNLETHMQHEIEMGRATSEDLISFYEKVLETQNLSEEEYIQYYRKLETLKKEVAEKDKARLDEQEKLTDDWQQKADDMSKTALDRQLDQIERERETEKEAAEDKIKDQEQLKQTLANINKVYDDQRLQVIVESLEDDYKLKENASIKELKLVKKTLEEKLELMKADPTVDPEQIKAYEDAIDKVSTSIDDATADKLADLQDEVKGDLSSAIQEGFEEGSASSALEAFGDSLKSMLIKNISDALAEAFMNYIGNYLISLIPGGGFLSSIFGFSGGGIVPSANGQGVLAAASGMIVPELPSSFGTDRVLSALTPDEMVLPTDISKYIIDSMQQSKQNSGGETVTNISHTYNLGRYVDKLGLKKFVRDIQPILTAEDKRKGKK